MPELDPNDLIQMVRIGGIDSTALGDREIPINKFTTRLLSKARENAKRDTCYLCKKPCTSFCNSHSIPKFTLLNVADKGKVIATLQQEIPLLGKDTGVNKAGTFRIICRECDSKVFKDYETPERYSEVPTDKMLAQIALKDYLRMLSRRLEEKEFYKLLGQRFPKNKGYADEKEFIGEYDLVDFQRGFIHAYKALTKNNGPYYHLYFYTVLDYVVPFAAQSPIIMVGDLEDCVINDIYNFTSDYRQESIHFAVFPLKTRSVVAVFAEQGQKRYRKFFKQFRKLTFEDQLATINYILFAYTENIFLSGQIAESVQENPQFMDVCRMASDVHSPMLFDDPLPTAIRNLSLSKRNTIPNLLSREYSLGEVSKHKTSEK